MKPAFDQRPYPYQTSPVKMEAAPRGGSTPAGSCACSTTARARSQQSWLITSPPSNCAPPTTRKHVLSSRAAAQVLQARLRSRSCPSE